MSPSNISKLASKKIGCDPLDRSYHCDYRCRGDINLRGNVQRNNSKKQKKKREREEEENGLHC